MRARWLLATGLLWACGPEATVPEEPADDATPEPTTLVGAEDVAIHQVAVYQGTKRMLALEGEPLESGVPLVAGRDALVRVFYTSSGRGGDEVTGRLELGEGEPIEVQADLVGASNEPTWISTLNFVVPGERIGPSFDYRVSILEPGHDDEQAAHHPSEGLESHAVEGPENTLRVILAPFRYDADGSGRVPDISPETVARYRNRLLQLFPVSDVEVSVREPHPWSQPIYPDGTGWDELIMELASFRQADGTPADVYYYGIFNPAETVEEYCAQGCQLGVTLLNQGLTAEGDPDLRFGLGVGYAELAPDTAAHELGHAHGRLHAPCGNPQPSNVDPSFPYPGGNIGRWGWDIVEQEMVSSGSTDFMGYCQNEWVSDYHFAELLERAAAVNEPDVRAAPQPVARERYEVLALDGGGHVTAWRQLRMRPTPARAGREITARLGTGDGTQRRRAHFIPYDHLDGGWIVVPAAEAPAERIALELDGRPIRATR